MLPDSKKINACLRNGDFATIYDIFPELHVHDYPMIFKETFPNACLYNPIIARQMIKHLYEPLNPLDRSALRATIFYAKNMLMRKIDRLKEIHPGNNEHKQHIARLHKSLAYLHDYLSA